ncbi:MAG TPA: hypothetical protein VFQ40_08325 [Actinomycetota bacterium]|nr:hypothetical protein [Actinomycetota bacterium]
MTKTATTQELGAPLGSVQMGRLVFTRGASDLTIGVDPAMDDLFRARFDGKVPQVEVDRGTVTVQYRPSFHPPIGRMTLSGRVPWAIRARGGMSDVTADLVGLELKELEIGGGSSRLEVRLPRPDASVPIRIGGGASNVEMIRPAGVPVRVRIGGGASRLVIDDVAAGSIGGRIDWKSPDYDSAGQRYDIEIGAGASTVTVRS